MSFKKKCWGHWHISWFVGKARTSHVTILLYILYMYTNNFWLWFKSIMVVDSSKLEMIVNTKMFTSYMQGLFWCMYVQKIFFTFHKMNRAGYRNWKHRACIKKNIFTSLGNIAPIVFYYYSTKSFQLFCSRGSCVTLLWTQKEHVQS